MMLTPLNSKNISTAAISTSLYVMNLYTVTEDFPLHVATKCVTRSSTLLRNSSPLTADVANPSSTTPAEYQRISYVRGGEYLIKEVTFSSGDYGKSILTPSPTSYLETIMWTPTITNPSISSWIIVRRKIRMIMVSTSTSNENIFLCLSSEWMACSGRRI